MTEKLFRVLFDLPEESASWPPFPVERMWTAKTGVAMEVRVRSIPFYVRDVSFDDTVRVVIDDERRSLVFDEKVLQSGHSTVRVILVQDDARSDVEALSARYGCPYEIDPGGSLWTIDIGPDVDYESFLTTLVRIAEGGRLEIQQAAVSDVHRERLA